MTLLEKLGSELPRCYYLGIDVGYAVQGWPALGKEHVAVVVSLKTFTRGDDRWKRARCIHFPSTQAGLGKLQRYLDGFSTDHLATYHFGH